MSPFENAQSSSSSLNALANSSTYVCTIGLFTTGLPPTLEIPRLGRVPVLAYARLASFAASRASTGTRFGPAAKETSAPARNPPRSDGLIGAASTRWQSCFAPTPNATR